MLTKLISRILLLFLFSILIFSCQSIKPYQRAYLNDRDMEFGSQSAELIEQKAQAFREGASGAGKGKTSGGCGCK